MKCSLKYVMGLCKKKNHTISVCDWLTSLQLSVGRYVHYATAVHKQMSLPGGSHAKFLEVPSKLLLDAQLHSSGHTTVCVCKDSKGVN